MEKDLSKVVIQGRELDLTKALPLRVRDYKQMQREQPFSESSLPIDRATQVVQFVCKKADPTVPDDFVEEMTLQELQMMNDLISPAEKAAVDRPT